MKIKQEERDAVVILRLGGKLMGGPDADSFQQTIRGLVEQGKKNVLVDMGDVSWVNSTGLGILISGYHTLRNAGGVLKLVRVNKRIDQIFMVTKLHTIFDSFDDEAHALASF